MKNIKVVVTGGSGMVGRSLKKIMPNAIYLSSSDYDLTTEVGVSQMYMDLNPNTVIHLAAKVGGIIDNINKPSTYFTDNILMNTLLLEYARHNGVERFVGILSTCIYPDKVDNYPMTEDMLHQGPPTPTNFSYGYAKRCLAVQIDACNEQYETRYQYFTPCNLYGEHDKFGNNSHFVAALLKKIIKAKADGEGKITLFGTGTPLRQFMHSDDLAKVIQNCLVDEVYDSFNVSVNQNISIDEIAKKTLVACGLGDMKVEYDITQPDGQFRKDVSNDKFLSIFPDFKFTPLDEGVKRVYDHLLRAVK